MRIFLDKVFHKRKALIFVPVELKIMDQSNHETYAPIYVVSGGRGLSGNHMVQALLIQYPENKIPVIIVPGVLTEEQVLEVVLKAKSDGGLIAHTMVNPFLRKSINTLCIEHGVKVIDFMGKLARHLDETLKVEPLKHPGLYRELNQQYFDRIDSIDYTLSHDDGLSPERLNQADIILTGVSRSGKTPLSIYLSMFGWKVANIPLVNGIQPPDELFEVDPRRVFGLNISTRQLIAHRKKRLQSWNNYQNETYVDEQAVREEIRHALFVFEKGGFTILNVSNKPIETTANEIMNLMAERFTQQGRKFESLNNNDIITRI